jgi:hypothetical protein
MNSKRIRKLRAEIITTIPKFPNDKATKSELESKHLTDLLIDYLNWAARLIAQRPREVIVEEEATKDSRWHSLSAAFSSLQQSVEEGIDLTPYLSLKAQEKGYTPAASGTGPDTDRWADKDFLLNVMGFYHLHLGRVRDGAKISDRTDEVIFARVDREKFVVIGIFDHSVFEPTESPTKAMTSERERLWTIFDKYSMQGVPANSLVIPTMIMTSGHNYKVVRLAQEYTRIIREFDPKIDDRTYIESIYCDAGVVPPKNPKFEWYLRGTDIGIFDKTTNLYVLYGRGLN